MDNDGKNMIQIGLWSNCCNACDFCLREERRPYSKDMQLFWIKAAKYNIEHVIDWNKFRYGISLLGGELYYITDPELQDAFLGLIDVIIEKVLKHASTDNCRYSTVTNGIYDPTFLYKVIDKIVDAVGIKRVDLNFSYDLKYRFKDEATRLLVLNNINEFHKRYNYDVGVQMILTQYLINMWKEGKFDVIDFNYNQIPGSHLTFLYPHPIHTGIKLDDFNFKRSDFLQFLQYMKRTCYPTYLSFLLSTKNSATFKYTGLRDRIADDNAKLQKPVLSDGKEILNPKCGHSVLYQCYSDTDKCMLCDLKALDPSIYGTKL